MTNFKVGDKVRILNSKAIYACVAEDGAVLQVVEIDEYGDPIFLDVDEEHLCVLPEEFKHFEKVTEVSE